MFFAIKKNGVFQGFIEQANRNAALSLIADTSYKLDGKPFQISKGVKRQ